MELATSKNIEAAGAVIDRYDRQDRFRAARRKDVFSNLHAAGSLSDAEMAAAERLMKDWAERMGIQTTDHGARDKIDGGGGCSELVNDRMIDAGRRIEQVFGLIGPGDRKLLKELVENIVLNRHGVTTLWRDCVQKVTDESNKVAQGTWVKAAVDNLRQAYDEIDGSPNRPGARSRVRLWFAPANEAVDSD